jgi:hypothetical protein
MKIRIIPKNCTTVLRPCCSGCYKYWQECGIFFVIYLSAAHQIRGIQQEAGAFRFVCLGLCVYACILHNRIRFVIDCELVCVCVTSMNMGRCL